MEQLKAMYPVCTLIKSDGTRCGSPALTGMNFCFHHIGGKIAPPKPETRRINAPINFLYPGSHEAIQHNLFLVVQALSEGKIDNATAITYNRLFRSAQLNLHRWQKSKLTHGEVESQMMPCAEPATNAGAPHLEEMWDSAKPGSPNLGAPHLEEMWEVEKHDSESNDQRSSLDEASVSSVSSVVKNEIETPGELNAERKSLIPGQPIEIQAVSHLGRRTPPDSRNGEEEERAREQLSPQPPTIGSSQLAAKSSFS